MVEEELDEILAAALRGFVHRREAFRLADQRVGAVIEQDFRRRVRGGEKRGLERRVAELRCGA